MHVTLLLIGKNQGQMRWMMSRRNLLFATLIICLLSQLFIVQSKEIKSLPKPKNFITTSTYFNATQAYQLIADQIQFGPRIPGSEAIELTRSMLETVILTDGMWEIEYQNLTKLWIEDKNVTLVNIIYTPPNFDSDQPYFLLLAHYDSRLLADNDPDPIMRKQPVLGANDGASGVAVAIELGHVLRTYHNISNFKILLVDAEDQGNIGGWDWLIGSRYFVSSELFQKEEISFVLLFDMVGGNNAIFKREGYSDSYAHSLVSMIWNTAAELGYDQFFINKSWIRIIDDHLPFLEQGIPAVDIIDDFRKNYKFWHTINDTLDQISIETLEAVGRTVECTLSHLLKNSDSSIIFPSFTFQSPIVCVSIIIPLFSLALIRTRRK